MAFLGSAAALATALSGTSATLAATIAASTPVVLTAAKNLDPVSTPSVAMNSAGQALFVWLQGAQLQARVRVPAISWGTRTAITPAGQQASLFDIVEAPSGEGAVVFSLTPSAGATPTTQSIFYTGGTWGASKPVPVTKLYSVVNARVRYDNLGRATLVWVEKKGTGCRVMTAAGNAAVGWGTPAFLGAGCYPYVQLAVNQAGEAVVGLGTLPAGRHGGSLWVLASRNAANAWTPLTTIGTGAYATPPSVALSDNGDAIAVFSDADLGVQWSRRGRFDGSWSAPAIIDGGVPAVPTAVAMSATGTAVAVYNSYYTVVPPASLVASTLKPGSFAWSPPTPITDPASTIESFQVAATPDGSYLVGWTDSTPTVVGADATMGVSVLRYRQTAWANAVLDSDQSGMGGGFTTAVAADRGRAIAVWNNFDPNFTAIDRLKASSIGVK